MFWFQKLELLAKTQIEVPGNVKSIENFPFPNNKMFPKHPWFKPKIPKKTCMKHEINSKIFFLLLFPQNSWIINLLIRLHQLNILSDTTWHQPPWARILSRNLKWSETLNKEKLSVINHETWQKVFKTLCGCFPFPVCTARMALEIVC